MFYQYPYTNLYNLNLDWIIKAVKELQEIVEPLENVVTSVNGMTGNVELTREILTQILGGMVSKFNGRDGDVELTAEDVNSTLIDITWTSDPGDTIDDLTQTELDEMYTSGKRILIFVNNLGVADQVYFLQYYDSHAQPQEYSPTAALAGVASFNGQTGNVTATGADLATSGTDARTIADSLEDLEESTVPVTRTVNNKPLSTNISINATDIPSQAITAAPTVEMALDNLEASKVPNARTVNNKNLLNDIILNDEDIPSQVIQGETTVEGALTDIDSRVSDQSQQIDDLQAAAAYVEDGDTATRTYTAGEFIVWKGELYTVNSGGLPLDTAISGNVTAVTGGGLNALFEANNTILGLLNKADIPFKFAHLYGTNTKTLAGALLEVYPQNTYMGVCYIDLFTNLFTDLPSGTEYSMGVAFVGSYYREVLLFDNAGRIQHAKFGYGDSAIPSNRWHIIPAQ